MTLRIPTTELSRSVGRGVRLCYYFGPGGASPIATLIHIAVQRYANALIRAVQTKWTMHPVTIGRIIGSDKKEIASKPKLSVNDQAVFLGYEMSFEPERAAKPNNRSCWVPRFRSVGKSFLMADLKLFKG